MKRQRKNRGFSLVELIVVVLIMGIIAVSLAPQVMKWVYKARESADFQAADDLKAVGQVIVAEYEIDGAVLADAQYNVTGTGLAVVGETDPNSGMKELFEQYMGGIYPKVQSESGKVFQIQIHAVGYKITIATVDGEY